MGKKLFISCATLGSGGAERVLSVLSKPFADEYDSVEYLLWLHCPFFYTVDERVKIVEIPEKAGTNNILLKMLWFRRYVRKESPNLILSFLWPWSVKVILSLLFTSAKIIVAERRDPRAVRGGFLMRFLRGLLYKKAKGIVVQTDANVRYYKGDVRVIYNPVCIPQEKVGVALKTKKDKVFVSVGRLIPEKNQQMLIKAFARLNNKIPDYRLVIYGDGVLRESLMELASSMGISEKVYLPGNSSNVIDDISGAMAFVLSSNSEGMPNALFEAMCIGLPCISTKVSGAKDLIVSEKNGILVDLDNEKQMAEAMERLALDEIEREKLGDEGIKVYELLRPDSISEQWVKYLNTII